MTRQEKVLKAMEEANMYMPQIKQILKENAMNFISLQLATPEKDMQEATDIVIKVTGGDIAVRIRYDSCRFRDLTIRARVPSYSKTEIDKIKEGYAQWYFYGWVENKSITEWMIIDLDVVRKNSLLDNRRLISNNDGTFFIAVPAKELYKKNCIVSHNLYQLAG